MCFGGSDDSDKSDDTKANVRPKLRPSTVTYPKVSNPAAEFSGEDGRSDYVTHQLNRAGFNSGTGVSDGRGNAILDGNGNPVVSGRYAEVRDRSGSDYDNSEKYNVAYKEAKTAWDAANKGLPVIDQDLVNVGMGKGGYLLEGYSPTNATAGIGPPSPKGQEAATKALAELMRNKYRGGTKYSFPGSNFDDPLGNALGSTLDETYQGSGYSNRTNQSSFDDLADAYNKPFRNHLARDDAGNVGETTFGQRFGAGLGNLVEGLALGQVLGPVGSMIGTGTNYNVMNTYGPRVPDWEGKASTSSFDYSNAVGGILGDQLAGYAAPKVGQKIYESTGDVNKAMMGAVATGIATTEGVGAYVGGKMQDVDPGIMSSDIKAPWQAKTQQENPGGFGASLAQDSDGQSGATEQPTIASVASDQAADLGAQTPNFDHQLWLKTNAGRANPNAVQPVSLSGAVSASASGNPLLEAQPDLKGVRYLQSGGTNRSYGTAMLHPINSMQQASSRRRSGLNDGRVGVLIG